MPVSRAFLNISSRFPSIGALPRCPPNWPSSERNAPFLEPLHPSPNVPGRWAPFRVSRGAPMERDAHLQRIFYLSSKLPSKETLPPGSLQRDPIERDAPNSRDPFSRLSKSPVDKRTPSCPTEPPWREMPVSRAFLSYSRVPSKGALLRGPPQRTSSERDAPSQVPPSTISQSLQ